jgi:hypothetical protein
LEDRAELVELTANASADLLAEREHVRVADRVDDPRAVLGSGDHAGGVQNAEVL